MSDKSQADGTQIIAALTRIGGPGASLDEQFAGGKNPFSRSACELARDVQQEHEELVRKFTNGGKA